MWMVALALLSVVGAWHAWRRNPAYSNRSTLRLVGVTALCIIALILVIMAAVNLTIHRSPAVAMGTMFAVVVVGALGMIFIIQYVSNRNFDRSLTALECNPWVHWQYSPAQWQQWTDVRVERMKATAPAFVAR